MQALWIMLQGSALVPQAVLKAEKAADFHSVSNTFDNDERSLM